MHAPFLQQQPTASVDSVPIGSNQRHRLSRPLHARSHCPELPDSTDFVCGTLDEDRPLEAAYLSCLEQKKRDRHVPIPQDIDPSFPTSDPEDMDEEDDDDEDNPNELPEDRLHLENEIGQSDKSTHKLALSRTLKLSNKFSALPGQNSPAKGICRSPPPTRYLNRYASPPPRPRTHRHSPTHLPLPAKQLDHNPATRDLQSANLVWPPTPCPVQGLAINKPSKRPQTTRTSSLPHTPNPFFHEAHGRPAINNRNDHGGRAKRKGMHIRGPVDIMVGLEKKRQKRKEKFWRQNCRKAAKEQAERKTIPGRGAERMRELGLECAERNRAYGLGAHRLVILSL